MPPTQPVMCAVVDSNGVGLSSMYVALDCSRRGAGASIKFESFTGSDGGIQKWFCSAESLERFQPVDAGDYERISMTFSTAMYFGRLRTPWVTIQANVDPSAFDRNYVKLQFGAGNSTYSVGTVFLPVQVTEVVGIELESQIHSERTGDGTKSNNDVKSSGSIGRNPGHRHDNTVPAGTPLGLSQPSTASILLLDSPLPSPSLSISTLYTAAEVITPLALPSLRLPVRGLHTPLKLDPSGAL
ncbi:hypothetical protein F5B17DRAFT_436854 [Nemania serpens]|nr:hypothetical protein F5B17DRAFT_436854 [Nemania serpens]